MKILRSDISILKERYEHAVATGKLVIQFKSQELATSYVKYLIEYVEQAYNELDAAKKGKHE